MHTGVEIVNRYHFYTWYALDGLPNKVMAVEGTVLINRKVYVPT